MSVDRIDLANIEPELASVKNTHCWAKSD